MQIATRRQKQLVSTYSKSFCDFAKIYPALKTGLNLTTNVVFLGANIWWIQTKVPHTLHLNFQATLKNKAGAPKRRSQQFPNCFPHVLFLSAQKVFCENPTQVASQTRTAVVELKNWKNVAQKKSVGKFVCAQQLWRFFRTPLLL